MTGDELEEGKRSAPDYALEGMRPLTATWLALKAAGLLEDDVGLAAMQRAESALRQAAAHQRQK
jgi:hypothetical protein